MFSEYYNFHVGNQCHVSHAIEEDEEEEEPAPVVRRKAIKESRPKKAAPARPQPSRAEDPLSKSIKLEREVETCFGFDVSSN